MKKENVIEKEVLDEILKSCNLYERTVVKIHPKICIKIYRKGLQDEFNWYNRNN